MSTAIPFPWRALATLALLLAACAAVAQKPAAGQSIPNDQSLQSIHNGDSRVIEVGSGGGYFITGHQWLPADQTRAANWTGVWGSADRASYPRALPGGQIPQSYRFRRTGSDPHGGSMVIVNNMPASASPRGGRTYFYNTGLDQFNAASRPYAGVWHYTEQWTETSRQMAGTHSYTISYACRVPGGSSVQGIPYWPECDTSGYDTFTTQPIACAYDSWSGWSPWPAPGETVTQTRTRAPAAHEPGRGAGCPDQEPIEETRSYTEPLPVCYEKDEDGNDVEVPCDGILIASPSTVPDDPAPVDDTDEVVDEDIDTTTDVCVNTPQDEWEWTTTEGTFPPLASLSEGEIQYRTDVHTTTFPPGCGRKEIKVPGAIKCGSYDYSQPSFGEWKPVDPDDLKPGETATQDVSYPNTVDDARCGGKTIVDYNKITKEVPPGCVIADANWGDWGAWSDYLPALGTIDKESIGTRTQQRQDQDGKCAPDINTETAPGTMCNTAIAAWGAPTFTDWAPEPRTIPKEQNAHRTRVVADGDGLCADQETPETTPGTKPPAVCNTATANWGSWSEWTAYVPALNTIPPSKTGTATRTRIDQDGVCPPQTVSMRMNGTFAQACAYSEWSAWSPSPPEETPIGSETTKTRTRTAGPVETCQDTTKKARGTKGNSLQKFYIWKQVGGPKYSFPISQFAICNQSTLGVTQTINSVTMQCVHDTVF